MYKKQAEELTEYLQFEYGESFSAELSKDEQTIAVELDNQIVLEIKEDDCREGNYELRTFEMQGRQYISMDFIENVYSIFKKFGSSY